MKSKRIHRQGGERSALVAAAMEGCMQSRGGEEHTSNGREAKVMKSLKMGAEWQG